VYLSAPDTENFVVVHVDRDDTTEPLTGRPDFERSSRAAAAPTKFAQELTELPNDLRIRLRPRSDRRVATGSTPKSAI